MFNQLMGMKFIVSEHAIKDSEVRVKTFPKRKARSLAHWRRMDKKWRKRYGFKKEPCIFRTPDSFIMHPSLYWKLKASLGEGESRDR